METLEQRIQRAIQEDVAVVPYNPDWPEMFRQEKEHLLSCLPREILRRIEHFGSTAVPNLAAKPIVDMLVEVSCLEETGRRIVPVLEAQGYDYFWRPTSGDDTPPFFAWFIKRDAAGNRTHHVHVVEHDFEHWDRLLFRDYLVEHPRLADEYQSLKLHLSAAFPKDRGAYTQGKTECVVRLTDEAKRFYGKSE